MQLTVSPERPAAKVRNPWLVVVPLAVASATAALQQSAMVPLLPTLPEALGTSVGAATWAFTASLLVGAVATPLLSRFGDMYGRRRVVLIALGLLVIGSVIGGVSTTLPGLLTARVLQGFSAALIPLSIGLAREALPRHQLATGIGVLSATLGFGSGGGMILAGVAGGYRAVFWVTGAVALVITVVVALLVREPAPPPAGGPTCPAPSCSPSP
ncbi:MFS transporter [Thermocatellispora tengchongensis]|uniref:MFS transporter n=1 Tax=Thermocatellispora tengchongensis TaxID=1073253 RepID=UPI003638A2C7